MGWHVRYMDRELKHEVLSPEFATREEALENAWALAQEDNDILGVEDQDEEALSTDEIAAWFEERASREDAP